MGGHYLGFRLLLHDGRAASYFAEAIGEYVYVSGRDRRKPILEIDRYMSAINVFDIPSFQTSPLFENVRASLIIDQCMQSSVWACSFRLYL